MSTQDSQSELDTIEQEVIRKVLSPNSYIVPEEGIELVKSIEAYVTTRVKEAKDDVLDELLEWYENPPINVKPFNWYGAVKALKISKDFKKPFAILPQASEALTTTTNGKEE